MIDIASFKNKILELALQGKLSQQKNSDSDINDLLKELTANSKKRMEEVRKEEKPFDIPDSWRWIRLGDVCSAVTGRLDANQQDSRGKYPFFTCGAEVYKTLEYAFDCDAILLGGNNASGDYKMHRYVGKFNAYQRVYVITNPPHEMLDYIYCVIQYWLPHLKYNSQGATTRFIKIGQVNGMLIPLPPLEEQIRIVDTINSAYKLLDEMEKLQSLYSNDASILKNKLIDAGIQGKLTEQLSEDGTAEELYTLIQNEKKQILQVRKGREDKNIKEVDIDVPYELPASWRWVRFGEIGLFKKGPFGSALTKAMFVPKSDDTVKVYEQQHAIQKNSELGTYYITREYFDDKMSGFEVLPGDILVSCAGTIGETYILPDDIEQGIINQALMRVSLVPSVNKRFFQYYFDENLKKTAQEESNGSAIKNIPPFDVMKNWYFPLPPYNEQVRIVEKLDELLSLM